MAAASAQDCFGSQHNCRDTRLYPRLRSPRRATTLLTPLYHTLLILILILCLAPISASALPATVASVASDGDVPQLPPVQTEEIASFNLHQRASVPEIHNANTSEGDFEKKQIVTAGTTPSSQLPIAFDTMANNFANASCVQFFSDHLENSTVSGCRPLSLYLQNSNTFFHDLSSDAGTSRVLDATCSDDVDTCAASMTDLADKLLEDDNCGQDYRAGNSVVQSTYNELKAYEPLYRASCLTNPSTNNYCFVDAVTNTSVPNDYNVYFIPIGSTLEDGNLTCNDCLKSTMDIYAHWATIDQQSLDTTYLPSARKINDHCGSGFAKTNVTVGTPQTSGAGVASPLPHAGLAFISVAIGAIVAGMF